MIYVHSLVKFQTVSMHIFTQCNFFSLFLKDILKTKLIVCEKGHFIYPFLHTVNLVINNLKYFIKKMHKILKNK